jgi:hypothetical protein
MLKRKQDVWKVVQMLFLSKIDSLSWSNYSMKRNLTRPKKGDEHNGLGGDKKSHEL